MSGNFGVFKIILEFYYFKYVFGAHPVHTLNQATFVLGTTYCSHPKIAILFRSDRVVHTLKRVTFGTNDRILDLLDTKIEFILCK